MLQMRYTTALLLSLILLAVGGLGVYFFERNRSSRNSTPALTEHDERVAAAPDNPVAREAARRGGDQRRFTPHASAEEVERQVTVPLEVTLAGMPRLRSLRSKSNAGLSWLHARFEPGSEYHAARQEVINRLQFIQQLPPGVSPQIYPQRGGETLRYLLVGPRDGFGRPIYTAHDLKTLQDWHLERELRRLPGVADICGGGGAVKRYEIQPDPDRLRRYGITLQQLMDAVARSNVNSSGDLLVQGPAVSFSVRSGRTLRRRGGTLCPPRCWRPATLGKRPNSLRDRRAAASA